MNKSNFAAYEKISTVKIKKTKHLIRIRLKSSKMVIINALKHVPNGAKVSVITFDGDSEDCCNIIFEEEILK